MKCLKCIIGELIKNFNGFLIILRERIHNGQKKKNRILAKGLILIVLFKTLQNLFQSNNVNTKNISGFTSFEWPDNSCSLKLVNNSSRLLYPIESFL